MLSLAEEKFLRDNFYVEEGKLRRKYKSTRSAAGSEAGWNAHLGYRVMQIARRKLQVHTLIYYLGTGTWEPYLDHIDGDVRNNKLTNLRPTNHSGNMRNTRLRRNNKSGYKGVSWDTFIGKWTVRVRVDGKYKFFGYHEDLEFAGLLAHEVRRKYHGEFANDGYGNIQLREAK